ncbi:MAG: molybdopterin molybdotransferase MoeA [Alphaproteobacteria bacterium]|nr:molybdopterin molybdotransferase MoeA [Alphaproteobacteria bacterium]
MTPLPLDEARALLLADLSPVEPETRPIGHCGRRTAAADVVAARDQPPWPVSAMDGYAVRAQDARSGAALTVIGEAPAGAPFGGIVTAGTAVRIATGGVVPNGAERIVVQEIVEAQGERIRILGEPGPASFVRPAGGDFRRGEILIRAGQVLTPARLGLAAAANLDMLAVRRRPRVAVLPSGDELREPGSPLRSGCIVNSAGYALAELIAGWGGEPVLHPILPDDFRRCEEALRAADLTSDIIVPLGGASVGDRDVLRPLIRSLGARTVFERIAVQPGKPCWHARFADRRLVLGLPGNPASAFVCAHLLLKPLLFALLGRTGAEPPLFAALTAALPEGGSREVYWRARLGADRDGHLWVAPDARLDSSLQAPLAAANALVRRLPHAPAAAAGETVETLLIGSIESGVPG